MPRSRGSTNCTRRRDDWKTRQAKWSSASRRASRPATGTPWRRCWPTTFRTDDRRRVVNAGVLTGRDVADREYAGDRRGRGREHDVDRHCDPRGAPRPHVVSVLVPRPATRGVQRRDARHRRDRRRRPDRRAASCSTPTTSTPPSPSSTPGTSPAKRLPTRTRGRSSREAYAAIQPARASRRRRRTG